MRTLVLDQGYQPHRVVSWQKAVTMLFGGKVEVVEAYDETIRSVSLAIQMPAVVRLLHRFRGHRGIKFSRMNVMARDQFTCQYCGSRPGVKGLTFDHVLPRSLGGGTSWTNIVTACRPCNGKKGNRTPEQAAMRIRKQPVQPLWLPVTYQLNIQYVPDRWSDWLQSHLPGHG